jgi:hypothetical protein
MWMRPVASESRTRDEPMLDLSGRSMWDRRLSHCVVADAGPLRFRWYVRVATTVLGGGTNVSELRDALDMSRVRLKSLRGRAQHLNEQNTKAALIEPVLMALGWDVFDPEEVHREYRRNAKDNPVDFALLLDRRPRLFIEAKSLGSDLSDRRWENQIVGYASAAGVEWVALTDGAEWRIYNAHAPVPLERKVFYSVRVDVDPETAVEALGLLSRDSVREARIDGAWRAAVADRQVSEQIASIFASAGPWPEMIDLIRARLPGLSRDEIVESLKRARVTVDFPAAGPRPLLSVPGRGAGSGAVAPKVVKKVVSGTRPLKRKVGERERRVRVSDMIDGGRLQAGCVLSGHYLGKTYEALLHRDGRVTFNGEQYSSLSAAGRAVKSSAHGSSGSASNFATDGFDFWRTKDARAGDTVPIKEIRRRTAEDQGLL